VVVLGLLTAPPGAVLRHPETGEILSGSPFMSGLIVLISALFFTLGFAYGKGAGTVKNLTAAIGEITATFGGSPG
jgi:aminobenzoyl-glutamate transport protein